MPPSVINNVSYAIINDVEQIPMPSNLISWLLLGRVDKETKNKTISKKNMIIKQNVVNNALVFNISDTMLEELLNKLPIEYANNYEKWLTITTVLKSLNNYNIWDKWSKQSKNYNINNNISQWNNNKGIIDVNYLVWLVNTLDKMVQFLRTL